MTAKPILDRDRQDALRGAIKRWYDSQIRKTEAAGRIGTKPTTIHGVITGRRDILPPDVLANLWKETGDTTFLMTSEEKERYRRFLGSRLSRPWPDEAEWPASDKYQSRPPPVVQVEPELDTEPLTGLEDLESLMAIVLRNMRRLANLPHTDPRRKAAQRRLPVLVMELFKQSVVLGLEYPGAFTDLIGQFNLAISAFSKKGGK